MGPLRCFSIRISATLVFSAPVSAFIIVFAMDKHHNVGVLLDGARVAEVGKARAAAAGLNGTGELG